MHVAVFRGRCVGMDDTTCDLANPIPMPESSADRLARYRSPRLNDAQHRTVMGPLIELVLAVPPRDATDARIMAAAVARYLSDVMPAEGGPIEPWLNEGALAEWTPHARTAMTHDTLANVVIRIRRIIRVQHNLPGRVPRSPGISRGSSPADAGRLLELVRDDEQLTAVLIAALGTGKTKGALAGAEFTSGSSGPLLRMNDGTAVPFTAAAAVAATELNGTVIKAGDWRRLLATATTGGIEASAATVRAAWLVDVVSEAPRPLDAFRLNTGNNALNQTLPHLEAPAGDYRDAFRGLVAWEVAPGTVAPDPPPVGRDERV